MKRLTNPRLVFVEDILENLPGFINKSRAFRSILRQNANPEEIAAQFRSIYNDWREAVCTAKRIWLDQIRNPRQTRPEVSRKLRRYLVRFLWKTQGMHRLKKRLDAVGCDSEKLRTWRQLYGRKYPAMMAAAKVLADYVDAYTDLAFSNVRCGSVYASPARMNRDCPETTVSRSYPFNYADDNDKNNI